MNDEQTGNENCADHEVRYCCPKQKDEQTCDETGDYILVYGGSNIAEFAYIAEIF
jgi:hypothetical protein